MAVPNTSEIITTTIQKRNRKITKNILDNNALLFRLKQRGKVKPFSGGNVILEELDFAENSTYTRYSGYETLNHAASEVLSSAQYDIKQCAIAVSISGLEELQNSGQERMIDLYEARVQNAEDTLSNNFSDDVYSDGTADSSKQIGGLQHIVADAPSSGTVGSINRASYSFWQNYAYDATTDGGAAATSSNIVKYMNQIWVNTCRGRDKVDLIVADNNYWKLYLEHAQNIQRIGNKDMVDAGYDVLKYMSADVVLDGGLGGGCPTNHMYFLNTRYLYLRPHSKRNFVPLDPKKRTSVNQDAAVSYIAWAGNVTCSFARGQGVLKD